MVDCPYGKILYKVKPQDTLWKIARKFGTSVEAIAAQNPGMNVRRLSIGQLLCVSPGSPEMPWDDTAGMPAKAPLAGTLRMLWEEHVFWTRMAIASTVFHTPEEAVVSERLLRNAADFEAVLRPVYGEAAARRFGVLLEQHLILASQLVAAAQAGNQAAAADAEAKWYANAAEIATFMGSINPYWPATAWNAMLQQHLSLTKAEAVLLLTQQYPESVRIFDEIERQALHMADMMTEGIHKQFPDTF